MDGWMDVFKVVYITAAVKLDVLYLFRLYAMRLYLKVCSDIPVSGKVALNQAGGLQQRAQSWPTERTLNSKSLNPKPQPVIPRSLNPEL